MTLWALWAFCSTERKFKLALSHFVPRVQLRKQPWWQKDTWLNYLVTHPQEYNLGISAAVEEKQTVEEEDHRNLNYILVTSLLLWFHFILLFIGFHEAEVILKR